MAEDTSPDADARITIRGRRGGGVGRGQIEPPVAQCITSNAIVAYRLYMRSFAVCSSMNFGR